LGLVWCGLDPNRKTKKSGWRPKKLKKKKNFTGEEEKVCKREREEKKGGCTFGSKHKNPEDEEKKEKEYNIETGKVLRARRLLGGRSGNRKISTWGNPSKKKTKEGNSNWKTSKRGRRPAEKMRWVKEEKRHPNLET